MPDSKRFLHPEAIRRIGRMDLRARHIVEGFLSGMHRSPYFGQSVEFLQHREYTPGDDLRHIDWNIFGRLDALYLKLFQDQEDRSVHLLIDSSRSMSFGTPPKIEFAATPFTAIASTAQTRTGKRKQTASVTNRPATFGRWLDQRQGHPLAASKLIPKDAMVHHFDGYRKLK